MSITSSGNVGIGTTSPNASLDAAGVIDLDGELRFNPLSDRGDGGRALVHYWGDILILNYGNDFAGGTQVHSDLNVVGNVRANSYVCNSSRELKKDITTLAEEDYSKVLKTIDQLEVVRYRYKEDSSEKKLHIGLIAEDSPRDILSEDGKSVSMYDSIGYLLAGMKALIQENQQMKAKILALERNSQI